MRAYFKLWSVVAIGLALLAGSLRAGFVYVTNAVDNNISAYRIGPNGALTPVAGSPFPAGNNPQSVTVDLLGRFVYVANFGFNNGSGISTCGIGADGPLAWADCRVGKE